MRVRISFDALRLCLLVAAGVTSGYLWRAAFESSTPAEQRIAQSPRLIQKAPAPPVVRIAPHHLTTTKHPAVAPKVAQPVVRTVGPGPTALISSHIPSAPRPPRGAPESQPPASGPTPKPRQPSPSPSTTPSPVPSPPPTTTAATTPPVSEPVQQAVTPPPTSTPTTTPPPPQTSGDESRPGWGKGDDNHDHSGPGGDDKDKGKDKGK
jgi:hypothetical protein